MPASQPFIFNHPLVVAHRGFMANFLSVDQALVKRMHAAGIQVFPFNVNSEPEFQRLIDTRADGLITDEPLLFKNWYSRFKAVEKTK